MAETDPISLTVAQLHYATGVVQGAARQIGMNWAIWDRASEVMAAHGIDRIELADWLANCEVFDVETFFGVNRYRVQSGTSDSMLKTATVMVHSDVITVEVIAINVED